LTVALGGSRIVAFITQPSVIDQILTHRRPRGWTPPERRRLPTPSQHRT